MRTLPKSFDPISQLSTEEHRIFLLIGAGWTNKEILVCPGHHKARQTLSTQITSIHRKLSFAPYEYRALAVYASRYHATLSKQLDWRAQC